MIAISHLQNVQSSNGQQKHFGGKTNDCKYSTVTGTVVSAITRFCFNCGDRWDPKHKESCKAVGQTCKGCSKVGHFLRMCRRPKSNNNSSGNNVHGIIELKTKTTHVAKFIVVNDKLEPILGLETSIRFGLIKRMDIDSVDSIACSSEQKEKFLNGNMDLFHGIGKFPGKFSIYLRDNSKPILHYKKRVPIALMDKVKSEIDQMIEDGIITPVDYPSDWVNNLQIVERSGGGRLRLCLDPKPLNACNGNIS